MVKKKIEILMFNRYMQFIWLVFTKYRSTNIKEKKHKKQNQRIQQKKSREQNLFIVKEINSISFVFFHVMYDICFCSYRPYWWCFRTFSFLFNGKLKNMFKGNELLNGTVFTGTKYFLNLNCYQLSILFPFYRYFSFSCFFYFPQIPAFATWIQMIWNCILLQSIIRNLLGN